MKIQKFYITLLISIIFLTSCSSLKEGMTGSKRSNTGDEFLVNKKKPLVMPPDFEKMPEPTKKGTNKQDSKEMNKVEELLGVYEEDDKNSEKVDDESLEKTILEKINAN